MLHYLLKLLKKILKPGGKAILTANSCYHQFSKDMQEKCLENTAWQRVQCLVQDYGLLGQTPKGSIYDSFFPTNPSNVSTEYQQYYLLVKDKQTNFKWIEDESGYQILPPVEAKKLKNIVNQCSGDVKKQINTGALRLLSNVHHYYREESFAALFKKAGFEVEQTFLIGIDGHLFFGEDPNDKAAKVGVIIKAPIEA